ncbi:protein Wnt-4 [Halyomorpha halys]|uniref:protein Wnt-4 n=1 Tax=Halyomorpha halys TaxID=286706 RepID=UPI0006D51CEB|nr:protein Wnt-1-like [Halyomorpha halys]
MFAASLLFLAIAPAAASNWWILGLYDRDQPTNEGHSLIGYKEKCHSYNFLIEKQKELCSLDEDIIEVLRSGMRMAIQECQYQFSMIRWNCSTFDDSPSIFGAITKIKSRETAFLYSISSAGVTYSVTRACSSGKLTECSCDPRVRLRKPRKHWQWGGCSEDIHYGEKFSREFIDCFEDPNTAEGLMNLHNNEAGRRVIRSRMQKVCKCHGMSGSCSVRACWRKLPPFRKIGDILTSRFEGASSVRLIEKKKRKIKKLRASKKELKQPNKTEMVYLEESPDYCERNDSLGILGTHGRVCRRDSLGLDGCKLLCCGRGYQTRLREVEQQCNCHFVWCCNVICEICTFKKEEHICN